MLLPLLQTLGWLVARTPEFLLRPFAAALGEALYWLAPRRRRIALSNLHHAFPDRPAAWRRATARASSRRLVETALLSLATPFLTDARLRTILVAGPGLAAAVLAHQRAPRATVLVSSHMAYWEVQTSMPLVLPAPFPEMGVIFRPLDNAAANTWVTRARERAGLRLLSRKAGFNEALRLLRRRGIVGVLFDQNAGLQGALTTLFGRVCSTSELPGLMVEKFSAQLVALYPRRLGFWRVELFLDVVPTDSTAAGATLALNRWLEQKLSADSDLCASWLWAHERWRHQDIPARRLRLESKRDLLAADLAARGLPALPRRTRLWIRLPNWLGDVVMAVPLLRALRVSRPDAEITLVAKKQFLPLLETFAVADRLHALPPTGPAYFLHFWKLRAEFPDVWLLFTNSLRGDLEARLSGARQRFGLVRPGKPRPLLTHAYGVPPDFDARTTHQLTLWQNYLAHFGLAAPPDRTPLPTLHSQLSTSPAIGLIPGSENNPGKRWPVAHWRALLDAFPAERFVLFGTAADAAITAAIAVGHDPARVENLAGRTTLPEYCARLRACRLLVTNDTGGLHLANALGVPLLALFGPTNPLRTGPVFSAPTRILQPPACPPAGPASLATLLPATVATAVRELLRALNSQP